MLEIKYNGVSLNGIEGEYLTHTGLSFNDPDKAIANYYFKKGQELEKQGKKAEAKKNFDRAVKMIRTALKRAEEGKYKK